MTSERTRMGDERCEMSDLPRSMCGHCAGAPVALIPPTPRPLANLEAGTEPTRVVWTPLDDKRRELQDWHDGDRAPRKGSPCRWVDEWGYYLREHEPTCRDRDCEGCKECTHDEHGNPVRHCTQVVGGRKRPCTEHLGPGQPLTCPRCIARVRATLAHIERLSALMLDQAVVGGVDSNAAALAGPVADPAKVAEVRAYVRGHAQAAWMRDEIDLDEVARIVAALPDDDDRHPLTLLWRWEQMLREDYGHTAPVWTEREVADPRLVGQEKPATVSGAVSYLSWLLTDFAQDPEQEFALFARELERCKTFLEGVLGASRLPERGAPCPSCPKHRDDCDDPACEGCGKPRLVRRRAHWCDKPDCRREHDRTGARDTWQCPRNKDHWWREADYRKITYEDAVAEGMKPRRQRKG